jgi:hypothetical protein
MLTRLQLRSLYKSVSKISLILILLALPSKSFSGDRNIPTNDISVPAGQTDYPQLNAVDESTIKLELPITADNNGEVKLRWTAPGDDGYQGRASGYDIRYIVSSFGPINNEQKWLAATVFNNSLAPSQPGQQDSIVVTGLVGGERYYFGIKTFDDVGNYSGLSNSPQITIPDNDLTLTIHKRGSGDVVVQPDLEYYQYRETIVLYAQASPNWEFAQWSGDISGSDNPIAFVITDDFSIFADFTTDFRAGDANGDGLILGSDVTYLVNYFAQLMPPPSPYLAGDANGDCTVTGSDVTYLVTYFRSVGPEPVMGDCY